MLHRRSCSLVGLFILCVANFPLIFSRRPDVTEQPVSNLSITHSNRTRSVAQDAVKYTAYKIASIIRKYVVPIIFLIGVVANTLSTLVMIQPKNRRISSSIYMVGVSICDTGVLCVAFNYWARASSVRLLSPLGELSCKVAGYMFRGLATLSVILLVFVTIDRFVAVRFPLRAKAYCTPRRARWMCGGLLLVVAIFQLPHLRYFTINGPTCQAFGFVDRWATVFVWFDVALNSLAPFGVLCVLNSLIVATLRAQARKFVGETGSVAMGTISGGGGGSGRRDGGKDRSPGAMDARNRQMVTLLLLVTIAMLLFTMPQCIRYIAYLFIDKMKDARTFALYYFWFNVSATWFTINYSINFFIYCLGGSKFRADLKELFRCGRKAAQQP